LRQANATAVWSLSNFPISKIKAIAAVDPIGNSNATAETKKSCKQKASAVVTQPPAGAFKRKWRQIVPVADSHDTE
jgi:hypothetical protein